MPNVRTKNFIHLHFLVFIAGFTAILGELISIGAIELVWYRMTIAGLLMGLFVKVAKVNIKLDKATIFKLFAAGILIALHWITFFESINQANVSITLSMFSTGAFFASFLEPIIYKRRIIWYEIIFGCIVVFGVVLITQSEMQYLNSIILGIVAALLSTLFAIFNGKFIQKHNAMAISFYEFVSGVCFISLFLLFSKDGFSEDFFKLSKNDWIYLLILGSICTAYAFIGSVQVMKVISPYTVILSYNLEPVYGIILAIMLFPENEIMGIQFYYGAILILITVFMDTYLKNKELKRLKKG